MRILIIGARGFFGGHVKRAVELLPRCEVVAGGRRADSDARIDLSDASTFDVMRQFDVTINCTDSVETPPLSAIRYCLENGCTFIDSIADPATLEHVLYAVRGAPGSVAAPAEGRVILGMGFMPGISNLLAKRLLDDGKKPERLEIAVRSSSFAGGGRGMAVLMARCIIQNTIRYENGHRVEDRPVSRGIVAPFVDGDLRTARVGLPEAVMLPWSTGARSTSTYVAPKPEFMRHVLHALAAAVPDNDRARRRFFDAMMKGFTYQRSDVYRDKPTAVEVSAIRDRIGSGRVIGKTGILRVDKGIECGAVAIAATVERLHDKASVPTGMHLAEELFSLDDIVDDVHRISNRQVRIEYQVS